MDKLLNDIQKLLEIKSIKCGSKSYQDYERMKWAIRDLSLNFADYDRAIKYVVDYLEI